MRGNFILGPSDWAAGLSDLAKIASQLFDFSLQFRDGFPLLDDDLIQLKDRLLQVHQQAFDFGLSWIRLLLGHAEFLRYVRCE